MSLALNFTQLKTIIEACAKQGPLLSAAALPASVEGSEQSAYTLPPNEGGKLRVQWLRSEIVGEDERREQWDNQAQFLNVTYYGNRVVLLRVFAESLDETDAWMSFLLLENLRSRIRTDSAGDLIQAAGGALVNVGPIVNEAEIVDDRMISMAYVDLTVNTGIEYQDVANTTIETVNLADVSFQN